VPDVPTTAEAGLPQLAVENWTAIMVPAATPEAAVARLGAEVLKIMAAPEIEERARTQGFRVDARGPQAFGAYLNSEVERWAKVIAAAKISAD
jgi:tripartite-type tricarboxylate transporter receptor subunit TctC